MCYLIRSKKELKYIPSAEYLKPKSNLQYIGQNFFF